VTVFGKTLEPLIFFSVLQARRKRQEELEKQRQEDAARKQQVRAANIFSTNFSKKHASVCKQRHTEKRYSVYVHEYFWGTVPLPVYLKK